MDVGLVPFALATPRRRPGKRKRAEADPFIVPPPIPPEPKPRPSREPPVPPGPRDLPWTRPPLPAKLARELHVLCIVDATLRSPLGSGSFYGRIDDGRTARLPTLDETEQRFTLTLQKSWERAERRHGFKLRRALFLSRQWRPHE
jgi:hypothetical protein